MPNFERGSAVRCTWSVVWLKDSVGVQGAALSVGAAAFAMAGAAVSGLKETYGKDLDFVET